MQIKNRFNLIDEPWIPVANIGLVSLKQLFSEFQYRALGGNPVQKIALTKLLLAIAQSACTPKNDEDWEELGSDGMAQKCLTYLEQWHDRFWLYGQKPFLQMPAIDKASIQSFGAVLPEISTGNTTVLIESHIERILSDAERGLLVVVLMGFGLGGKKTDNKVVLTPGYGGKGKTGRSGPSVGFIGYMHSFLLGETLLQTLWLNLFTHEQIQQLPMFLKGIGIAPWEIMPEGEACSNAELLQHTLMGRLLPLSRFCLLKDDGLHYSEGISHLNYNDGVVDPTVAVNYAGKKPKVLWIDPERRPWRQLTSLLTFMGQTDRSGFDCAQIRFGITRARKQLTYFGVWSGGVSVSSNAGEQFVTGANDFVESTVMLNGEWLGELWYEQLKNEMTMLEAISKVVYGATTGFYNDQKVDGQKQARLASNLFWQLCERKCHDLINSCVDDEKIRAMRRIFIDFALKAYDTFCSKDTARQVDAWAKNYPNLNKYLT